MSTAFPALSILVVEDDPLQTRAMRVHLRTLGYDPPFEATSLARAEELFAAHSPDLVLLDIHLGVGADGIELAQRLRARRWVPLIFLTSAHDLATFERATAVAPQAFLTKPYDEHALFRAIELAARFPAPEGGRVPVAPRPAEAAEATTRGSGSVVPVGGTPTHLWLRDGSRMVRAAVVDLLCIESDDSYSHFYTAQGKKFTVRQSLRDIEEGLPAGLFQRIHRSYLVQIASIESVDLPNNTLTVGAHTLPIGRSHREELVRRLGLTG